MKGRPPAAHFAAFPRPPNYLNPNTTNHTHSKEKKLKRILASVFLVLAVIAAVGIFGVQTSNQVAADATIMNAQVNGGDGVPNRTILAGQSHVIDLSRYVTHPVATPHAGTDDTASTTFHVVSGLNTVVAEGTGERYGGTSAEATIRGSMLTVEALNTAGTVDVKWVADSTPTGNDPAVITTYDTNTAANGPTAPHTFRVTVVASAGDPALPASGAGRPLTTGLSSTALSTSVASTPVTWTIANFPASGYTLEASAEPEGIVETSVSAGVLSITPLKKGAATIKTSVINTLGTGGTPDPAAANDKFTFADQTFTVTYAQMAPVLDIKANTTNAPDTYDKTGEEDSEIVYTIRSDHTGEVGRFITLSAVGGPHYTNRNVIFGLVNSGDQNLFDIDTGDPYRSNAAGAPTPVDGTVTAVRATLSVAAGATLEAGRVYTFKVTANDQIDPDGDVQTGRADEVDVTVRVIQGNRAPVLNTLAPIVIPDATTVGATLLDLNGQATDADRNRLSYTVVAKDGSDNEDQFDTFFDFDTTAGVDDRFVLKLKAAVDYDDIDNDPDTDTPAGTTDAMKDATRWTLTITVTDGSLEDSQDVTVSVSDSGVQPVSQVTNVFYVPEGSARDTVLGVIGETGETWTGFTFNPQFGPDNRFFRTEIATATEYNSYVDRDGTTRSINAGTHGVLVVGGLGPDETDDTDDDIDETFNYEDADTTDNVPPKRTYTLAVAAVNSAVNPNTTEGTTVTVNVTNVNEKPAFGFGQNRITPNVNEYVASVSENAEVGRNIGAGAAQTPDGNDARPNVFSVTDPDAGDVTGTFTYSLVAENSDGDDISDPEVAFSGPFAINRTTGAITVTERLNYEATRSYELYIKVTDDDATDPESATIKLTITVEPENEPPIFVTSSASTTALDSSPAKSEDEDTQVYTAQSRRTTDRVVETYYAWDPDGDDITFVLRTSDDANFFEITTTKTATGRATGQLKMAATRTLDYENQANYSVEIEVVDNAGSQNQILQEINLRNLNDNAPVWQDGYTDARPVNNQLSVNENTQRGHLLATYVATDADGDPITYTLSGPDGSSYQIGSSDGMLKTLKALDAESDISDRLTITATDNPTDTSQTSRSVTRNAGITINGVDDRIGAITVKMANPVLGTHGDPNTALVDRKITLSNAVPEAPADLPAIRGAETASAPVVKFVETADAGWGTVLRIEVTAQSPDSSATSAGGERCGNGNQCVVLTLEGDDSDDVLKVMAYRSDDADNLFIAAVMPVQNTNEATTGNNAVYKHSDGSVPRIKVDEEDTLIIKFGNLRDRIRIDNEAPEFSDFLPEHEDSIDDDEVKYTFTVRDDISGIPEPEDLPDADGDDNYMAVVALVNSQQCHNVADGVAAPSGTSMVADTNLHEDAQIYCPTATNPRERVIVDDKDLDSVPGGFEVETEVVLNANEISYVTFIACDKAGNCVAFDPDENDNSEALAEITVDTIAPDLTEARAGVMWDSANNEYDDSRSFIQAIFTDLSKLNPDTIEEDDFVVDGHTIKRVYWYDDPDTEDQNWGTRFDTGSGSRAYREISKTVFIELEEELLPDATPDVSVVPNGLEDEAGKEQDDDEVEADDWIAPKFAVQSITSPLETSRDNVLAGEDDKVVLNVTSDERISTTKPLVDVHYVNAPAGCVDRAGIILRQGRDTDGDGRLEPGEARADCAESARGGTINSVISKDGTNEWTITVDKPSSTGYYNVYIYADDRSSQNNRGSEGVAPADIGTKFFEKDGDVNADDAVFFEGDVQLPKPQVVVSGEDAGDTEPTVEFKSPLFIEVDFTEPFSADCSAGDKLNNKLECTAETAEYAEDGFDAVTITRFELNGVDMTDDVKTTDDETFLVALDDVGIGDHELKIQATDVAGNELKDVLEIEFEVEERDPFTRRLNPGWNLVSLPGSPADSAIASVFGSDIEVRTVYTYNPVTPGGWQVAVRETLDDAWQGDLTDITAKSGYWVLSDAIQDLEVSIPRLAGGAVGASTPVQPPVIPMYAGWNLIPVVDVTGDALDTKKSINATTYLNSLDDGLDLARVLGFNTITNEWFTVIDPSDASVTDNLQIGSAYWVFVRESASLVPGGIPR